MYALICIDWENNSETFWDNAPEWLKNLDDYVIVTDAVLASIKTVPGYNDPISVFALTPLAHEVVRQYALGLVPGAPCDRPMFAAPAPAGVIPRDEVELTVWRGDHGEQLLWFEVNNDGQAELHDVNNGGPCSYQDDADSIERHVEEYKRAVGA